MLIEALVVGTVAAVAGLVGRHRHRRRTALADEHVRRDGARRAAGRLARHAVAASLVVGVVVTVLAAWLPARRAAKIPPVAAMSSVHADGDHPSLVRAQHASARCSPAPASALVLYGTTMDDCDDGQTPMARAARSCC